MPTRRRHLSTRSFNLPIRTTSYRPPVEQAVSAPATTPLERLAQPARRKTMQTSGLPLPSPIESTITAEHVSMVLPIPPSINKHYATVNGRRLLSSAGRAYKMYVGQQVWIALARSPLKNALMKRLQSEPLAFSVRFFFTTALRRDLDSGLKITQDAICEGLGLNDNRIVETHLYKHVDKLRPRIEISLAPAPDASESGR